MNECNAALELFFGTKKKRDRDNSLIDLAVLDVIHHRKMYQQRIPALPRIRWEEDRLVDLAVRENSFMAEYRMSPSSFNLLHEMLEDKLRVDDRMAALSQCRSGNKPISTRSPLAACLILLGGGRSIEVMRTHGVSKAMCFANFKRTIEIINSHPNLKIVCDNDIDSLKRRAKDFTKRSTHRLFKFCTAAIDGLAIRIRAPRNNLNQTRYYSGNKKMYCLNMQGVCDANCKFLAMSCKHSGSTNDGIAFQTSDLAVNCSEQPFPFHWVGDPAYPLWDTLIIPYTGVNLHIVFPSRESFNFWHSQLRITIERTFGIFMRRFGIFWKALEYDIYFVTQIVHACCRIHNFLMETRSPMPNALDPIVEIDEHGQLVDSVWQLQHHQENPMQEVHQEIKTGSALREHYLAEIERNHELLLTIRSHNL